MTVISDRGGIEEDVVLTAQGVGGATKEFPGVELAVEPAARGE